MKLIDLTGQVFGRLTVIKRVDDYIQPSGRHLVQWLCLCTCGKEKVTRTPYLMAGDIESCGCLRSEVLSVRQTHNLIGKRFGYLTVIERAKNNTSLSGNSWIMWSCLCDCGNIKKVSAANLRNGHVMSCGCMDAGKGVKESFIAKFTKQYIKNNYEGISEYREIRNPKTNSYLKYDSFIPKIYLYIEIHGIQHYIQQSIFYKTKEDFLERKRLDKIKKKHAEKVGYYLEIDLRKTKSIEKAIELVENKIKEIVG